MATHNSLNSLFTAIANSIRNKKGTSASIVADNFPNEIDNLPAPSGTINITQMGTYDVSDYATANVKPTMVGTTTTSNTITASCAVDDYIACGWWSYNDTGHLSVTGAIVVKSVKGNGIDQGSGGFSLVQATSTSVKFTATGTARIGYAVISKKA